MAAIPHVSSAESLFHEALDVSQMLPRVQQQQNHSGFSTAMSMSLDFQDKFALERSLPSYSSSSSFQLVGSAPSWEQQAQRNAAASDTHFFSSNVDPLAAAPASAVTIHAPQHEILVDWQQMGDFASGLGRGSAALSDGERIQSGLGLASSAAAAGPAHLLAPETKGGWNSAVEAASQHHHGGGHHGHCFMPFGNGNAAAAFAMAGDQGKDHIRSGGVAIPLCPSDASKLPLPLPVVVEAKVEASVDDTSGTKTMLETSQASVVKETTGRKRRASSGDKFKDGGGGSCVTSSGIKDGGEAEVKGKRQRNPDVVKEESLRQHKTAAAADRSSSDNSASTSPKSVKENTKPPEPPKDYIHVRARRGQATDSHSLAERVRREKISERMKFLQDLVPGCNKVTGKAVMLDEIINYVQSLQRQVEFLSMKLAAVNPRLEFSVESLLGKEMQHGRNSPTHFVLGQHQSYSQQLHQAQHSALQLAGLDLRSLTGLQEAAMRRPCIDPYSEPVTQASVWDGELQNIVHMMSFVEAGP